MKSPVSKKREQDAPDEAPGSANAIPSESAIPPAAAEVIPNLEPVTPPAEEPAEDEATVPDEAAKIAGPIAETAAKLYKVLRELAKPDLPPELVPGPATRCINCGEVGKVTYAEGQFHCDACKHTWIVEDEQAPFRRMQRGGR